MKSITENPSSASTIECPSCTSSDVSTTSMVEDFQYGEGIDAPRLSAVVRVHECADCQLSFTTEDASEIKHEAVCRHLGVLTPKEVRGVRERYGFSQSELSELSKIGKASLARWENGLLIQNHANDNLLYLLTFADNVSRLKLRARPEVADYSATNIVPFNGKFRAIPEADMERLAREARSFNLHPIAIAL